MSTQSITQKFCQIIAVALGILFLGLIGTPTASAGSIIENYPYQVFPGTEVTIVYAPDVGETSVLNWSATDQPNVTTTCSQADPAGCQYKVKWMTVGFKQVCLNKVNEICNGSADIQVVLPSDLPAPVIVRDLYGQELGNNLASPFKVLAYTPKDRLSSLWNKPEQVGNNAVRWVAKEGDLNKFEVTVVAPPGPIKLFFLAFNASGGGTEDRLQLDRTIATYDGPAFGQFGLKYQELRVANGFRARIGLYFMSTKRLRWNLISRFQKKVGKKVTTLVTKKSTGLSLGGNFAYQVNDYKTKLLPVQGPKWRLARAACRSHATYRVVIKATLIDPTTKRVIRSKTEIKRARSVCSRSVVSNTSSGR